MNCVRRTQNIEELSFPEQPGMDLAVLHWVATRTVFRPTLYKEYDVYALATYSHRWLSKHEHETPLQVSEIGVLLEKHWGTILYHYAITRRKQIRCH